MFGSYHAGADVYDQAHSWRWRVLLASFPTDPMGSLVRAVLGKITYTGMAHGLQAEIDKDGVVRTLVRDSRGHWHADMPVGTIVGVRDEFRRLADHCRLADDEREALFEELRKWIAKDHRAQSFLDVKRHN